MLFLPTLMLTFSAVLGDVTAENPVRTFNFRDPTTGTVHVCDMCPPGEYMSAPCGAGAATRCAPCAPEHFTQLWNYLPRCLYCSNFCHGDQEVDTECSPRGNRVCRCKEGFYWTSDFCLRHSACEPGHGVRTNGTSKRDTVCEECADGFFSSPSPALETCVKHQECAGGQSLLLAGSPYHDAVCGTCEDLADVEKYRTFLTGFFAQHRMRVAKMKKFVTRNIGKSVPRQRGPLEQQFRAWLARGTEEELRKLPQLLRDSQLTAVAEKLEERLQEIKLQSPGCSLSPRRSPTTHSPCVA